MKNKNIRTLQDIFFTKRAVMVLEFIFESNNSISISQINLSTHITYAHLCKIVHELIGLGILTGKKDGRKFFVGFTPVGKTYTKKILEVYKWQL